MIALGLPVRKSAPPSPHERRSDGVVAPSPQEAPWQGIYLSRDQSTIPPEEERDGTENVERNVSVGLMIGKESKSSAKARVPFSIGGHRFVLEVPVDDGDTAGFATFRTQSGHIVYRVLSEGQNPRELIDNFADFYRNLVPDDAVAPSDNPAADQIAEMNAEDIWRLGYPDGEAPSKVPKLKVGVLV